MKAMIFIFVRELIKRILKEEREKDLSPLIKTLLNDSIVNNYKGIICNVDVVAPWKRGPIGTHSDFKDYQVRVNVIGGLGSKRWPQTQSVYKERDKIVNDVWHTVYNFMGLSTDVFLRNVKSCDEVLTESSNERIERLISNYITMSYPTAKKIRLAPPGVNGSITTFTLPNPEDEKDNLIFKFDVFGKPEYNINPEFFNSIKSLFGEKKNIKKLILKWFEEKEVDEDLIQNSETHKQEQNESELTERCWKGYTQKGMKTMFGKRYPNCVKIKKKRVNESNVIDYLKKFVGYKATDQKYQFQKIVDIITKITKRDNPIEGLAGVAVTHVKKDMWGQTFTDPKSVGMRWDFKVILRPLFTEFNPNKEEDYSQKVLKFELDFLENAHGMGLGITSPIEHENVKDYKVTFEWTSPLRLEKI
jgi:hypothetical protein